MVGRHRKLKNGVFLYMFRKPSRASPTHTWPVFFGLISSMNSQPDIIKRLVEISSYNVTI